VTRRTDWAEYAYPGASEDRGGGGREGSAGGGDSVYGDAGPHGGGTRMTEALGPDRVAVRVCRGTADVGATVRPGEGGAVVTVT